MIHRGVPSDERWNIYVRYGGVKPWNERSVTRMNRLRSYAAMVVATVLLVGGQVLIGPSSVAASPSVPEAIPVPSGYVLLFSSHARGVQIYECRDGQWAFHAPRAELFDPQSHQRTAIHYGGIDHGLTPGPWWESVDDGSRIRAGNPVIAPSPNPNSIPLLGLEVLEQYGTGVFSQVSYIQRLNTEGGVGPTGECQGSAQRRVAYTADYYFYGTPESPEGQAAVAPRTLFPTR